MIKRITHLTRYPRFTKYALYAIGEIILIVIGILIASQIDNWNEDRKIKIKLRVQLNELVRDLEQDADWLRRIQIANTFRYQGFQYMLKMSGHELINGGTHAGDTTKTSIWPNPIPNAFDKQYYDLVFVWVPRVISFNPVKGTIEQIKSEGLFYYIMDEKLKRSIDNYYYQIDWQFNDIKEAALQARSREFQVYLKDKAGLVLNHNYPIPEPVELMKLDSKMKLNIIDMGSSALYRAENAEDSRERALRLIEDLKAWLQ